MAPDRPPTSADAPERELAVDRLEQPGAALAVAGVHDASFGAATPAGPRAPHRHDYHELIWTRRGSGHHLVDGEASEVRPGFLTLIGRGQVHVFARASGIHGAIVRFGDELLHGAAGARVSPGWLLGRRGALSVPVPAGEQPRLEATIEILAAEARRPADTRSAELQRHFLLALLLWVERWHDAVRTGLRDADDAESELHRRFAAVLEEDFQRHPDAGHYADALGVPQAALARALTRVTGRATKEHIIDRRMLEAARLLRFTDLSVGEVAFRAGFADQLYFSRAFRRRHGEPPVAYRERLRGR